MVKLRLPQSSSQGQLGDSTRDTTLLRLHSRCSIAAFHCAFLLLASARLRLLLLLLLVLLALLRLGMVPIGHITLQAGRQAGRRMA